MSGQEQHHNCKIVRRTGNPLVSSNDNIEGNSLWPYRAEREAGQRLVLIASPQSGVSDISVRSLNLNRNHYISVFQKNSEFQFEKFRWDQNLIMKCCSLISTISLVLSLFTRISHATRYRNPEERGCGGHRDEGCREDTLHPWVGWEVEHQRDWHG